MFTHLHSLCKLWLFSPVQAGSLELDFLEVHLEGWDLDFLKNGLHSGLQNSEEIYLCI